MNFHSRRKFSFIKYHKLVQFDCHYGLIIFSSSNFAIVYEIGMGKYKMYVIKIKTKYLSDQTGKEFLLPALYTESGFVLSHLRFLAYRSAMSSSWKDRSLFSLKLLIEFIHANDRVFTKTRDLLLAFSQALVEGTINPTTLEDPSELFWPPRKLEDAKALLLFITTYTDWLTEQEGYNDQRINPYVKATSTEQRLNWCAYYHKHARVFLNHLLSRNYDMRQLDFVRAVRIPQAPKIDVAPVKKFPESEIQNLLDNGFTRGTVSKDAPDIERIDYKGRAITLLMHYGGIRKSEALHLYVKDITFDEKSTEAIVRVYHPQLGSPPGSNYSARKEYLAKEYQLRPRNEYPKSERLHLGWKLPLLSDKDGFFTVHFCPPIKAGEFMLAWANYLKYQRVSPPEENSHPYAFTNSKGEPETLKNFQRLHTKAVERIGLKHKKYHGTTEHGHRHSYGYRLAAYGLSQVQIQKSMHHKSPDSCLVYTQPSDAELRKKMMEVE